MAKSKSLFEWRFFRLILTLASTVVSIFILAFSSLAIVHASQGEYESAPQYMVLIFIALGAMSILIYLKDRTKINLIRSLVLLVFDVVLGIIIFYAKDNYFLFSVTAGLYCITIVISRIFLIIQNHSVRNVVFNVLIMLFAIALGIGLMVFTDSKELTQVQQVIIIECVFVATVSLIETMTVALAQLKVKVLFKIILNTFSLEILFGLLAIMVCFSIVFTAIEPAMKDNFPEALWYCFAVVTTIGFGDVTATTPIGRILTVILGIYGLIVVAVITSIIVNFYNETTGKKDKDEFKDISEEEGQSKKKKK